MNIKLLLLFVFPFLSCNNMINFKLKNYYSKSLDQSQHSIDVAFSIDSNIVFLGGSFDSVWSNPDKNADEFAFVKQTAILFRTKDNGKTRIKKSFNEESISKIKYMKNRVFIISTSGSHKTSHIYMSDDMGDSWKTLIQVYPPEQPHIFQPNFSA